MTLESVNNEVTPEITGVTEVWCDPRAGLEKPQFIKGPYEGAVNEQSIVISLAQTEAKNLFPAGATLTRNSDKLELYRTADLDETKKLVFCENQARITNKELSAVGGTKFYAKGANSKVGEKVDVELALKLDPLETAECKYTKFNGGMSVETGITVKLDGNVKQTIKIISADLVSPVLAPQTSDSSIRPTGDPLQIKYGLVYTLKQDTNAKFKGSGEIQVSPKDSKIAFYSDKACGDQTKLVFQNGLVQLSNKQLNDGGSIYIKATDDDVKGTLDLVLNLKPDGSDDTKKLVPCSQTLRHLRLEAVNTVTPDIKTDIDMSQDDKVWYPTLNTQKQPKIILKVEQTHPSVPFGGEGMLERSSDSLELFFDPEYKRPLTFIGNRALIQNQELPIRDDKELLLYAKGVKSDTVKLTFRLSQSVVNTVVVKDPAETQVSVQKVSYVQVNPIWSNLNLVKDVKTNVTIAVEQSDADNGTYAGEVIIKRSDVNLKLFDKKGSEIFPYNQDQAKVLAQDLSQENNPFYVIWTSDSLPKEPLSLICEALPSNKPYIITNASQLRKAPDFVNPTIAVHAINTITPVIETDYDLVLKNTGFSDKPVKHQTTATIVKLSLHEMYPSAGYAGNGVLERANDNIMLFVDPACTQELVFTDNKLTLHNADLRDQDKRYYIYGAKAGACSLTLSLDKIDEKSFDFVRFKIGEPKKKDLAVIDVRLDIYFDNGVVSPATAQKMTDRTKRLQGRVLPAHELDDLYGRAKLEIAPINTQDWPQGAVNHVVTMSVTKGLEVMDKDAQGNVVAKLGAPLTLNKQGLASIDPFWLRATSDVSELGAGKVISLGLSRTDKDTATYPDSKKIEDKSFGDWCSGTSIQFSELTPSVDDWHQYTNQPIQRGVLVNANAKKSQDGQQVLVTATINPQLPGIGVDFMLSPGAKNASKLPKALLSMDLKTHGVGVTDDTGKASAYLKLSRYSGDKFNAACFLSDASIKGADTVTNAIAKQPKGQLSHPMEVWRKLECEIVYMNRHNDGVYTGTYENMFDPATFVSFFESSFLKLEYGKAIVVPNAPALYRQGGAPLRDTWYDGLVANKTIQAPRDRFFTLIFIENLATTGTTNECITINKPVIPDLGKFQTNITRKKLYDLSKPSAYLQDVTAAMKLHYDGKGTSNVPWVKTLDKNSVSIINTADGCYKLDFDLSGINLNGCPKETLKIEVFLKRLEYSCGVSIPKYPVTYTAVRYAEQNLAHQSDEVFATAVHEVGHFLGLTPLVMPVDPRSNNLQWYYGQGSNKVAEYFAKADDKSTTIYNASRSLGVGRHCMKGYGDITKLDAKTGSAQCLMYHAAVYPPVTTLCDTCRKSIHGYDYSLSKTGRQDSY